MLNPSSGGVLRPHRESMIDRASSFDGIALCLRFLSFAVVLSLLAGCMDVKPLQRQILVDQTQADKALKEITPKSEKRSALVVDERPWYGSLAVPIQNGEPLPTPLMRENGLVLTFERPLNLRELGRIIQSATGIRVSVNEAKGAATVAGQGSDSAMTFIPADGAEVSGGRVVWQGTLKSLLDQISDAFDVEWDYDGQVIRLSQEVTRTYMLHALAGKISMDSSLKSESGEGTTLPDIGYNSDSTLEIWSDISTALNSILKDDGKAEISPATGTVTVTGPPSLVEKTETYLRQQNKLRLRRIAVAVKVLDIDTSDVNEVTFNLASIFKRAFQGKPFQFTSTDSGLTAGILKSVPTADTVTGALSHEGLSSGTNAVPATDTITSILQASEEIDRVSVSQAGAVVTLSDIPAPLQIGSQISYLKQVSRETDDNGNTTTSLEAGQINTGLTMNVLPRVIEKDKVLLRVAIGIKEAPQPFATFGSNDLEIQLPEVQALGFMQNAVLESGETLVLSGFEKNQVGINDTGTPGGLLTGGTKSLNRSRRVNVLLLTAEVLPEEPLTVLSK